MSTGDFYQFNEKVCYECGAIENSGTKLKWIIAEEGTFLLCEECYRKYIDKDKEKQK